MSEETEVTTENVLDTLRPPQEKVHITLGLGDEAVVYTQKPLSFFGKMEFFALLGDAVDKALRDGSISLDEIFDFGNEVSDEQGSHAYIRGIAKLVQFAPEFLKDLYCVALNVPRDERYLARSLMELSEDEGGLSDEAGVAILDRFIDQNYEAINDFFGKRMMPLWQKVISKAQGSTSSKPSKPTRTRTTKQ